MKKTILSFLLIVVTSAAFSQDDEGYKTGIGLRAGLIGGLTVKHFIKDGKALEGIFSSGWGWRGYQITGLYEVHKAAFTKDDVKGFQWFYGAGMHFGGGYWHDRWHETGKWTGYWERDYYNTFGIDGIFGLEYKIPEVPIAASIDLKPFIEFSSYRYYPFRFWDSALSVRFVF